MREFQVMITADCDIPACLSESLKNMGSLAAPRERWASLLNAMGVDLHFHYHKDAPKMTIKDAAATIVAKAISEGERAVVISDPEEVVFMTPASVMVTIKKAVGGIDLIITFGRDSTYLATLILADLFRRVPCAVGLLAEVANEAHAKYREQEVGA